MKIAFAGASGTGKTTLAKYVAELYGIPMNPVGSRAIARSMGFRSPYDVDAAGKRGEFQRRLQSEKIAWEVSNDSFVTDRTTLDELVYTMFHDVDTAVGDYHAQAKDHMAVYDLIFFCHADTFCSIEGDEARRDSRGYQLLFSDVLAGLLSDTYSGVCPLEMSDLGKRKELVRAEILEYLEIEPPSTSA